MWLRECTSDVLTALSAGVLGMAGIGASWLWVRPIVLTLLLVGLAIAVASIAYERTRHRPTLTQLTIQNTHLIRQVEDLSNRVTAHTVRLIDIVNILLRELATSVNIYSNDTRLSVYRHRDNSLYLVGRVSPNVDYARVGRDSYPDTQGFIGRLWRGVGTPTVVTMPASRADWEETQVRSYGFTDVDARGLRMQTRAMTGIKLQLHDHGEAFGVLCIECDRPRSTVRAGTINSVVEATEFKTLTSILHFAVMGMTEAEAREGLTQGR
ncbi:hypothetical protein A5680_05730 [Mycobacterium sp. E2989]|nr:hypothetical protein A5702_03120 [Mycobacterium sp. E3339]OBH86094.1 hypothetical protein A5680_05730 [Mycobacterium sp. E2989]